MPPANGRKQNESCGRVRTGQSGTTLRPTPTPNTWHRFRLWELLGNASARACATMATKARPQMGGRGRRRARSAPAEAPSDVLDMPPRSGKRSTTQSSARAAKLGYLAELWASRSDHSLWPDELRKEGNGSATITLASRGLYPAGPDILIKSHTNPLNIDSRLSF